MTGHQSHNQAQPNPDPEAGLQRLVTQIGHDRQGGNPTVTALADVESKMLRAFATAYPEPRSTPDAGAALLVFGQLCADLVPKLPAAAQQNAGPLFINLARLVGEALMSNRLAPAALRCPYRYAHGAECKYLAEAPDEERRDATMRAHVGLHHPDQQWPCPHTSILPVDAGNAICEACHAVVPWESPEGYAPTTPELEYESEVGTAFCACGQPAELVVQEGDTAQAQCLDCVRSELLAELGPELPSRVSPEDCTHPKHARVRLPGGARCSACGEPEVEAVLGEPDGADG